MQGLNRANNTVLSDFAVVSIGPTLGILNTKNGGVLVVDSSIYRKAAGISIHIRVVFKESSKHIFRGALAKLSAIRIENV